ncbi:MAG TPA: CDGSH iron-sulfur domain-containing protein [Candidatus Thermoplasmatota archaeon]|jgi:CDGSH-type Zn-finger protein|nr:CDGSH iron-sulfur domain-containing protein [Candidatus Thermoplasmatota archaeon]
MTRFIERERKKPFVLKPADLAANADDQGNVWICGCGRSATQPFCDGTHQRIAAEPKEGTFHDARGADALRHEAKLLEGSEEPLASAAE